MNKYLRRILISVLIVLLYFTVWQRIRSFVISEAIIPQIEYAISNCDETIAYDQLKSTSLYIYLLNHDANEYETFGYVSPAGFYLLFGLVIIVLAGGSKFFYYLLLSFHGLFWMFSTAIIIPGLCTHSIFLHIIIAGNKYITPFLSYLILILLISPNLKKRLNVEEKMQD